MATLESLHSVFGKLQSSLERDRQKDFAGIENLACSMCGSSRVNCRRRPGGGWHYWCSVCGNAWDKD